MVLLTAVAAIVASASAAKYKNKAAKEAALAAKAAAAVTAAVVKGDICLEFPKSKCKRSKKCFWSNTQDCTSNVGMTCSDATGSDSCAQIKGCFFDKVGKNCVPKGAATCDMAISKKPCKTINNWRKNNQCIWNAVSKQCRVKGERETPEPSKDKTDNKIDVDEETKKCTAISAKTPGGTKLSQKEKKGLCLKSKFCQWKHANNKCGLNKKWLVQ